MEEPCPRPCPCPVTRHRLCSPLLCKSSYLSRCAAEANNFFDEKGDVKKGKYFEDGWVDESPGSDAGLPNPLEGFFNMFRMDKKKD